MIVKCEQCQTRFKIPDEKVTDKGVKVRCNKCGHTFRVTRDMAQPATPSQTLPPAPAKADPFARFGAPAAKEEPPPGEVTRPGVFALGVEASRNPDIGNKKPAAPAPAAFDFGALAPPNVPSLGSAPPPPPPPFPAAPPKPPAAPPSAFDFSAIAPPTASSAPTSQAPAFDFSAMAPQSAPTTQTPAFDFSAFTSPGAPPAAAAPAAFDFAALGAPPGAPAPSSAQAFDFGPPPPEPPPPPPPAREEKTQVAKPFGSSGFLGDNAPAPTLPNFDGATARAMFDLPSPSSPALPDILPPPEPEDYSPPPSSLPKQSVPTMPAAPTPELLAASEPPKSRRGVVGIFVNIVIAALLVLGVVVVGSAYLNDGKVSAESLSVDQLKNTFAPSVPYLASDVTNGLYDTRAGRAVFYVRGEVANRSDAPVKLVVKAEIVEGGKVVRSAESYVAEQPPTVEELYAVDGADALEALQARVEKRSTAVAAGGTASFVVAFTEYPPDLKGFRVRVSARAVTAPTAAR